MQKYLPYLVFQHLTRLRPVLLKNISEDLFSRVSVWPPPHPRGGQTTNVVRSCCEKNRAFVVAAVVVVVVAVAVVVVVVEVTKIANC